MKRALIVASVGVLASTVWVVSANAQANINPNVYRGNTSERYGGQAPYEWYGAPGPMRRGNMCVTHTDINRGYGYLARGVQEVRDPNSKPRPMRGFAGRSACQRAAHGRHDPPIHFHAMLAGLLLVGSVEIYRWPQERGLTDLGPGGPGD